MSNSKPTTTGTHLPVARDQSVLEIQNNRLREKIKKQSRTHALLVSIVIVFALSWFPLNVLNIILDIHNIFEVIPNFSLILILMKILAKIVSQITKVFINYLYYELY